MKRRTTSRSTPTLPLFLAVAAATGTSAATLSGCGGRGASGGEPTTPTADRGAEIGDWGFALDDMDKSIDPGDDFFRFANGKWLDTFEIPSDFSDYGAFTVLFERAEDQVKAILEEAASMSGVEPGSNIQKIGDFYEAFLDVPAIEERGMTPAEDDLATLGALSTHEEVAQAMGRADLRTE